MQLEDVESKFPIFTGRVITVQFLIITLQSLLMTSYFWPVVALPDRQLHQFVPFLGFVEYTYRVT